MSGTVIKPGFDQLAGTLATQPRATGRRINRYRTALEGGGNRALNRHTFVEGTGIGFTAPDQITDSNNGLDRFSISELFVVQGTANNNFGWYPLVVAPGAITVAFGGVTTEGAGANVILKTVANLFRA